MEKLTKRQQDVLDYIKGYIEANRKSPTMREISDRFKFRSRNSSTSVIKALAKLGRLYVKHKSSRGIRLIEDDARGGYFTLFAGECLSAGCTDEVELFGYCSKHYSEAIDAIHDKLTKRGVTRPTPKCFTDRQWKEYEVHSLDTPSNTNRKGYANPCMDCTPEHKREMRAEGRCDHPETVFIVRKGREENDIEGINSDTFPTWERACRGNLGPVVELPPIEARLAAVDKRAAKELKQ